MTRNDGSKASSDGTADAHGMVNRRHVLAASGTGLAGLAGCMGGGGDTPTPRVERETVVRERTVVREQTVVRTRRPANLSEQHALEIEGAVTVPVWLYGINNGAWREQGIDMSLEVAAFGKFARQVVAGLSNLSGGVSVPALITQINEGNDIVLWGMKLNNFNKMFTLSDTDIEPMPDGLDTLSGMSLGVPFTTSTTTNSYNAIFQGEFGYDILNEPAEVRSSPPPVLWNLLLNGELDVIIEFSGFTIRGTADDRVKTLFDPYEYWTDKYGVPPPVAAWASYRDWLQENAGTALNHLNAWRNAHELFRENTSEAIQNYGRLGGLTTEGQANVARDWMTGEKIIGPHDYTQEIIDNHHMLYENMLDIGAFDALPAKDELHVSHEQLREWADM